MDLPCEDPAAGCSRYALVVARALPPGDDLVLVGHSLGGLTIPLVAARRPVRGLVFLCAAVPEFGRSLAEQVAADPGVYASGYAGHPGRASHPDGSTSWPDAAAAREAMYHDCTPDDARRAWVRLRRQAQAPRVEPCPLHAWPDAFRASVYCEEDRAVNPEWSRRVARERLSVEAQALPGSHSPFWSRPAELAALLDGVVRAA